MRSERAHLAEISLDFAGISARRDEIFPYERSLSVRRDGIFISTQAWVEKTIKIYKRLFVNNYSARSGGIEN